MKQGIIYVFIATVLFSLMEISLKVMGGEVNPIQLSFIRFLVGGLFLLPLAIRQLKLHNYKLTKEDYKVFALAGFIGIVVSMSLYTLAVEYITATQASVIFCSSTFFATGFAHYFAGEKIGRRTLVAIIVAITGFIVMIKPWNMDTSPLGLFLIISSAITFAIYSLIGKVKTKGRPIGGMVLTCYSFIFGVIELAAFMGLSHIGFIAEALNNAGLSMISNVPFFSGIDIQALPLLAFICIGVTGVGYGAYFAAIDKTSVTFGTLVLYIKPVLAPIFAMILLNELIKPYQMIGIILIAVGATGVFVIKSRTSYKRVIQSKKH